MRVEVSKVIVYRDPINNRLFAMITTKTPGKSGVGITFYHTPAFARMINIEHGLYISGASSDCAADQIMVKNGCKFVKRLPVSPGEDFKTAYQITQSYLMACRFI